MSTKIEEALWSDYKKTSDLIDGLNIENVDSYKIAMEDRDKIRTELIKIEQMKNEERTQIEQQKNDSKKDFIKNTISTITFGITTIVSIYTINKTFKFDQEATVTSTLGRGILNSVIPKFSKR